MDVIYNIFAILEKGIVDGLTPSLGAEAALAVMALIKVFLVANVGLIMVMVFIYMERRVLGRFQVRIGPNRVGPGGILQPLADAVKIMIKEDIVPKAADRLIFNLAPVMVFVPVMLVFAVIPFGVGMAGGQKYYMSVADLDIGILYVLAVTSLGEIAVLMAGWSSNNKFALFGAMRAAAQLVSYEVPLVLAVVGVVIVAGSLSLTKIVEAQAVPFIFMQPLGFVIFITAVSAELNRTPFDLLEAESELVTGYHVEYSGMKFGMFYLAEYLSAFAFSAIISTLFLGGWQGPILPSYVWLLIKILFVFFVFIWVRATLPRVRIDQVMALAWKFLLPLALINIGVTAVEALLWPTFPWFLAPVNIVIGVLAVWAMAAAFRNVWEPQWKPARLATAPVGG